MRNRYAAEFWIWVIVLMLAMLAIGCSTEYSKGWSWGVLSEDGDMETHKFIWGNQEFRVDDILLSPVTDPHQKCREKHYCDPYTKVEYCLPENFTNMNIIHLYKVK